MYLGPGFSGDAVLTHAFDFMSRAQDTYSSATQSRSSWRRVWSWVVHHSVVGAIGVHFSSLSDTERRRWVGISGLKLKSGLFPYLVFVPFLTITGSVRSWVHLTGTRVVFVAQAPLLTLSTRSFGAACVGCTCGCLCLSECCKMHHSWWTFPHDSMLSCIPLCLCLCIHAVFSSTLYQTWKQHFPFFHAVSIGV